MTTAASAAQDHQASQSDDVALPLRGDTILGVCEAIGTDLGFNPNFLRVPLATLILLDAKIAIGAYLGLGLVVALARWLYPVERRTASDRLADSTPADEAEDMMDSEERLAA